MWLTYLLPIFGSPQNQAPSPPRYHRLDLSALAFLYQDAVPAEIVQNLLDQPGSGMFGQNLAASVLTCLEKQLELSEIDSKQLDSWHHSFQAARAMLRGRLALSSKLNQKLGLLSFFSDLIPCLLLHPGGDRLFAQLLSQSRQCRRSLQRKCLETLASQLYGASEEQLSSARMALQRIVDDILWPLRHSSDDHVAQTFQESATLVLDIVDSHKGLFGACYDVITPALGASAMQALLEVIHERQSTRPQFVQLLSKSFSDRVQGCSFEVELPLHVWIEWPQQDSQLITSSLPNLLYLALCTSVGRDLLNVGEGALDDFHRNRVTHEGSSAEGISFASVRSVAHSHQLLDAVAANVSRLTLASTKAAQLVQDLRGFGHEAPEILLFFDALIRHAGSTASAGKALRILLEGAGSKDEGFSKWAEALEKPERGTGGSELRSL